MSRWRMRAVARIAVGIVVIVILLWGMLPALTMTGATNKVISLLLQSLLVSRILAIGFRISRLVVSYLSPILQGSYIPMAVMSVSLTFKICLTGADYLSELFLENNTSWFTKLLALYNVRYVIMNPPSDPNWQYYHAPEFYEEILNHTAGLTLVNLNASYAVYIDNFTLEPIRLVPNLGVIVGDMSDELKVMTRTNLSEWAFLPAEQVCH